MRISKTLQPLAESAEISNALKQHFLASLSLLYLRFPAACRDFNSFFKLLESRLSNSFTQCAAIEALKQLSPRFSSMGLTAFAFSSLVEEFILVITRSPSSQKSQCLKTLARLIEDNLFLLKKEEYEKLINLSLSHLSKVEDLSIASAAIELLASLLVPSVIKNVPLTLFDTILQSIINFIHSDLSLAVLETLKNCFIKLFELKIHDFEGMFAELTNSLKSDTSLNYLVVASKCCSVCSSSWGSDLAKRYAGLCITSVKSSSNDVQCFSILLLGEIGSVYFSELGASIWETLIGYVDSDSDALRESVSQALGTIAKFHVEELVPRILAVMKSPSLSNPIVILRSLKIALESSEISTELAASCFALLLSFVRHSDDGVKQEACICVGKLCNLRFDQLWNSFVSWVKNPAPESRIASAVVLRYVLKRGTVIPRIEEILSLIMDSDIVCFNI